MINKDTKIYGSFSTNPGNNGCKFFNSAFHKYGIDAIYKSFYSDKIDRLVDSVKYLNFSGFALSMPHKIEVYSYLNEWDEAVVKIGACNTVVIKNGKLHGYNTDWMGVSDYFDRIGFIDNITIIGNGGFSKAIQYACQLKGITYTVWGREDIPMMQSMRNRIFFNATPAEIITKTNLLIDGRPFTDDGKEIAGYQARHQFKLYTGIDYEE
jgi:shikimate 5-dehydrogenase